MPGTRPRRPITLASALAVVVLAIGLAAGSATGAKVQPRKGAYKGNTKQTTVVKSARKLAFKVKGKRITMTVEPIVARNFCLSQPTFVVDGETPSAKIKGGRFKFSRTFSGSKFNVIKGEFIDEKTIEGTAKYHFDASDAGLCGAGKTETKFSAKK